MYYSMEVEPKAVSGIDLKKIVRDFGSTLTALMIEYFGQSSGEEVL